MSRRLADLALASACAGIVACAALLARTGDAIVLPGGGDLGVTCWVRQVLGVDCPTCGMTRSFVALAHGHLGVAFHMHPAGPLLFASMVVFSAAAVLALVRARPALSGRRWFVPALELMAAACLVLGLGRSLFSWLLVS